MLFVLLVIGRWLVTSINRFAGSCVLQVAAAAALSLLSAHDPVIQDSIRYLGGIAHLVAMMASPDPAVVEVARCCLHSLRHQNYRNQAEIVTSIRSSPGLTKDYYRLSTAADLLAATPTLGSSAALRRLEATSPLRQRPYTVG